QAALPCPNSLAGLRSTPAASPRIKLARNNIFHTPSSTQHRDKPHPAAQTSHPGKLMIFVYLVLGLVLLVAGGEFLVKGAVKLAEKFRISPLLIGLTLVGFGTSTPELVTSLQAAFAGSPGIA